MKQAISFGILALILSAPAFNAIAAKSSGSSARSAVSGKYVSKGYAAKNPKTTVVEQKAKK